jgi:hypothetical protein
MRISVALNLDRLLTEISPSRALSTLAIMLTLWLSFYRLSVTSPYQIAIPIIVGFILLAFLVRRKPGKAYIPDSLRSCRSETGRLLF